MRQGDFCVFGYFWFLGGNVVYRKCEIMIVYFSYEEWDAAIYVICLNKDKL